MKLKGLSERTNGLSGKTLDEDLGVGVDEEVLERVVVVQSRSGRSERTRACHQTKPNQTKFSLRPSLLSLDGVLEGRKTPIGGTLGRWEERSYQRERRRGQSGKT
jgi:hypothetical protein